MLRTALSRPTVPAAGALALVVALTGCGLDGAAARAAAAEPPAAPTAVPSAVATTTPTAVPTPSAPPRATAAPVPTRSPAPTDVAAVQRRLRQLRYFAGEADGRPGPATRSALVAFQKVQGLPADGVAGPRTLAALAAPRAPQLRLRAPADRVEVDLDRQVLHVVEDGRVVRTVPVSSGNGRTYREPDGTRTRALTPVGTFRIERRIVGVRRAALGTLYDPQYFHGGWAVHGSDSVPAVPASHGCVRVTRADAKALLRLVGVGTTVHLHGGTHVFRPTAPASTASATATTAPAAVGA